MADSQEKMGEILQLAHYEIHLEALERVKTAISVFVDYVRLNEPGTLRYDVILIGLCTYSFSAIKKRITNALLQVRLRNSPMCSTRNALPRSSSLIIKELPQKANYKYAWGGA